MDKKLMECLTNPIKCKLLLEIYSSGHSTAKQLADIYNDIPQATLYRYLKRMTDDGILKIVEETPIRGAVEKTYSLAIDINSQAGEMLDKNSGQAYMQMFMQYILGFMKQFQDYCIQDDIDIIKDMSGFSIAPVYASDTELKDAMISISEILKTLSNNKPSEERKLRSIGFIITPPKKI